MMTTFLHMPTRPLVQQVITSELLAGQDIYQPPDTPGHLLHETEGGAPWRAW